MQLLLSVPDRQRGLTLIELMVTLSVLALLAMVATPSFRSQLAASALTSATTELQSTLARTRADAVRLGSRVSVCASGGSSTACGDASTTWNNGWLVFRDATRQTSASVATVDSGEEISHVVNPLPPELVAVGSTATNLNNYVSYAADGRARSYGGAMQAGTIRVCSKSSALTDDTRARDLVIQSTGRVVLTRPTGIAATCPAP